jgi:hypothetical protein
LFAPFFATSPFPLSSYAHGPEAESPSPKLHILRKSIDPAKTRTPWSRTPTPKCWRSPLTSGPFESKLHAYAHII